MTRFLLSLTFSFVVFAAFCAGNAYGQAPSEGLLQINGVTMTSDSLRAVPAASVTVRGKNRGVYSSPSGVFSIVVMKGDTLDFTALGFRPKQYVVPRETPGRFASLIQLLSQDTFYLAETIIRPLPSKEGFGYAFVNWDIPNDQYEIARRNTEAYTMRILASTLPKDGGENASSYQVLQQKQAVYYGQQPPSNLFNPIAWMQFFEAWKRGDFRRQR